MAAEAPTERDPQTQYYIVWNAGKTEGFVTDDEADARSTLTGRPNYTLGYPSTSTAGAAFRETYEDDDLTLEEVRIVVPA